MRIDFLNRSLSFIEKEMLGIISECESKEKMTIDNIDKFKNFDEKRFIIKKMLK